VRQAAWAGEETGEGDSNLDGKASEDDSGPVGRRLGQRVKGPNQFVYGKGWIAERDASTSSCPIRPSTRVSSHLRRVRRGAVMHGDMVCDE
jgi:hypothetical protein